MKLCGKLCGIYENKLIFSLTSYVPESTLYLVKEKVTFQHSEDFIVNLNSVCEIELHWTIPRTVETNEALNQKKIMGIVHI